MQAAQSQQRGHALLRAAAEWFLFRSTPTPLRRVIGTCVRQYTVAEVAMYRKIWRVRRYPLLRVSVHPISVLDGTKKTQWMDGSRVVVGVSTAH